MENITTFSLGIPPSRYLTFPLEGCGELVAKETPRSRVAALGLVFQVRFTVYTLLFDGFDGLTIQNLG